LSTTANLISKLLQPTRFSPFGRRILGLSRHS
jgi:hypothetical protein